MSISTYVCHAQYSDLTTKGVRQKQQNKGHTKIKQTATEDQKQSVNRGMDRMQFVLRRTTLKWKQRTRSLVVGRWEGLHLPYVQELRSHPRRRDRSMPEWPVGCSRVAPFQGGKQGAQPNNRSCRSVNGASFHSVANTKRTEAKVALAIVLVVSNQTHPPSAIPIAIVCPDAIRRVHEVRLQSHLRNSTDA